MTLTTASAKHIRRRLEEPDGGTSLAKANALLAEANRLLDQVKADRARMKALPRVKAPGATRDERRAERNERAAEIRAEVMKRADGRCEWCHKDGFVLDWAHVIDGNGSRRAHEAVDTTAGVCADCHHRGWHKNRMETLLAAKEWAIRSGFREALAAIEKKIAKVEEGRRVAPF